MKTEDDVRCRYCGVELRGDDERVMIEIRDRLNLSNFAYAPVTHIHFNCYRKALPDMYRLIKTEEEFRARKEHWLAQAVAERMEGPGE